MSHHQTRFDEGLNRQYSPNYANYHPSPLGSIPGQDLSATLMELANIQSRSLEMMTASQRSQQQSLPGTDKSQQGQGKWHDVHPILRFLMAQEQTGLWGLDWWNRPSLQGKWSWLQDQNLQKVYRSGVRSSTVLWWAHRWWTSPKKLRSCFSHAPTMNEAREELRNMRQLEHESVSVYMYRWGRALYRSSGIQPENERHPNIIKDFISSLKKNIRNKITNRWTEMRQLPNTVQKAF